MREIAFDTETTGLEPKQGHRIVEIGCVELIDKVRTGKFYHAYVNPERDVPQRVINIHGITGEFLADKPLFRKVAREFLAFVGDAPLVIHNASFDMKFINFELERASLPEISDKRAIDTLIMARGKFPGSKASLDALCERFGINLSRREKHGALLDAELLAEVYICLTGGKQGSMFQDAVVDAEEIIPFAAIKNKRAFIPPRQFVISDEEAASHKDFISKKIKNALWGEVGE
jgi:DNA polymerase-3 subunit epsilon